MSYRFRSISIFSLVLPTFVITAAQAQNPQNFLQNSTSQIQQAYGSGAINPGQAAALQNRDAQIVNQEQQDMAQNGGHLTRQEKKQIDGEVKGMDHSMQNDVRSNNPNANMPNRWFPQQGNQYPQYPNGVNPNWNPNNPNYAQQQQNWRNWNQNNPNNQSQNPNGNPYHHHHRNFNNQQNQNPQNP